MVIFGQGIIYNKREESLKYYKIAIDKGNVECNANFRSESLA